MSDSIYVGLDLGGTTIKVGICNEQGNLIHKFEGPTGSESGSDAVIENMASYARQAVNEAKCTMDQVAGVGAGIPGFLNIPEGIVKFSPNIGLRNVPLKKLLETKLDKIVKIDNDANAAALGEAWAGSGVGIPNMVCYTIGTGVGGGIIIKGKIYEGFNGMAGELGHIQLVSDLEAVQCNCGQLGCLESISSATAILRMARDAVERGDRTSMSLMDDLSVKDVFDEARVGDEVALRIVNRAAFYIGRSMTTLAVIINPQRFILGGGVSRAGEVLLKPIRETFKKYTPEAAQDGVDIVLASLGNDAGIIGAAGLNLR